MIDFTHDIFKGAIILFKTAQGISFGALAIALLSPTHAHAQSSTTSGTATQPESRTGAQRQPRQGGVTTIVVTAQRRSEDLQDVPVSVQALGQEQLDQLKPGEDLVALEHAFDNLDLSKADEEKSE